MNNTISVVIPLYNAENFIDKCLNSVLNQDCELPTHSKADGWVVHNDSNPISEVKIDMMLQYSIHQEILKKQPFKKIANYAQDLDYVN